MKRRDFLVNSAGLAGTLIPALGLSQSKPCPPSPVSAVGGMTVTTACGPSGAAADWKTRSTGSGVLAAFNGTDAARREGSRDIGRIVAGPAATGDVTVGMHGPENPNYTTRYAYDERVKCSGDYSVRLDLNYGDAEGTVGPWISLDNYADQFGENSTFYVQWRQRFNSAILTTDFLQFYTNDTGHYLNSTTFFVWGNQASSWQAGWGVTAQGVSDKVQRDGTIVSATYNSGAGRTEVICNFGAGSLTNQNYGVFSRPGTSYTAFKQSQFVSGLLDVYPEDSQPPPLTVPRTLACYNFQKNGQQAGIKNGGQSEIVLRKSYDVGSPSYPGGYHSQYTFTVFRDSNINGSILSDQNLGVEGGPFTCQRPGFGTSTSGCQWYVADEWMTFKVKVTLGAQVHLGTSSIDGSQKRTGFGNSTFELYMGRAGQPTTLIHKRTGIVFQRSDSGGDNIGNYYRAKYGWFEFMSFMTKKDPGQNHATASTWFDEIIVSRSDIPDPKG